MRGSGPEGGCGCGLRGCASAGVLDGIVQLVPPPFSPADISKQLDYCTYCPKMCRHACPVSTTTGRETLIPQAKMDRLNQLRLGRAAWTVDSTEALWACTGCRQCTTYCEHDNEPGLVLMAGRAQTTARAVVHPRLSGYPERFRAREQRLIDKMRDRIHEDQRADAAPIGFWPGCDALDKGMNDVAAALDLFERIGATDVRVVDTGTACAGYPLLASGYVDAFRWHATRTASALEDFRTLVINCSACVYTLRSSYPAEGAQLGPDVLSLAEFLADFCERLPTPTNKKVVYYHDPCYLARYEGIIDAPRQVLEKVADVREFGWSHQDTECCGGGGLLPKTMPDAADAMARRRLREVARGGGGTVVTSCATCAFMLKSNAPSGVDVYDLPTAVQDAVRDI